ncbi:MAG: hypothetical protein ABIT47_00565 [Candidatus Paceibacterota bacterium]
MSIHPFARIGIIVLSIISVFVFPWSLTMVLMIASGLVFPPAPFFVGILADVLYYSGHGLPHATLIGLFISVITFGVQHFVKTRIM